MGPLHRDARSVGSGLDARQRGTDLCELVARASLEVVDDRRVALLDHALLRVVVRELSQDGLPVAHLLEHALLELDELRREVLEPASAVGVPACHVRHRRP